jgi:hypothetical protein
LNTLAPIVLFVYNRLEHTYKTVEALKKNKLSKDSELFIYSDGAKNKNLITTVDEVRKYIDKIDGFKKITIIKREKNWGLDPSVIDGVTTIINKYGKIIVLEDDIITSPYFLKFINEALDFYEEKYKVWHISGWNYPIEYNDLEDVFLYRLMNCSGGWATWKNRWKYFESNLSESVKSFSLSDKKRFRLKYGYFWKQVQINLKGDDNNWDIRWYSTIFKQNGLCLNPSQTFVRNIGFDGSGIHCGKNDIYHSDNLCLNQKINFTSNMIENNLALKRVQEFYKSQKKPLWIRIINKLSRIIIKNNIIK